MKVISKNDLAFYRNEAASSSDRWKNKGGDVEPFLIIKNAVP